MKSQKYDKIFCLFVNNDGTELTFKKSSKISIHCSFTTKYQSCDSFICITLYCRGRRLVLQPPCSGGHIRQPMTQNRLLLTGSLTMQAYTVYCTIPACLRNIITVYSLLEMFWQISLYDTISKLYVTESFVK